MDIESLFAVPLNQKVRVEDRSCSYGELVSRVQKAAGGSWGTLPRHRLTSRWLKRRCLAVFEG